MSPVVGLAATLSLNLLRPEEGGSDLAARRASRRAHFLVTALLLGQSPMALAESPAQRQELVAALRQLDALERTVADSAARASELATSASGVAAQGGEVVAQVVQTWMSPLVPSTTIRVVQVWSVPSQSWSMPSELTSGAPV